jgi:hypothetical protein
MAGLCRVYNSKRGSDMCIVCVEIAKGKLTHSEAKRALAEIAFDPKQQDHAQEVTESIENEEKKTAALDKPHHP